MNLSAGMCGRDSGDELLQAVYPTSGGYEYHSATSCVRPGPKLPFPQHEHWFPCVGGYLCCSSCCWINFTEEGVVLTPSSLARKSQELEQCWGSCGTCAWAPHLMMGAGRDARLGQGWGPRPTPADPLPPARTAVYHWPHPLKLP